MMRCAACDEGSLDIVEVFVFLFSFSMLIYISFNLYVLYSICNSLQDKDTSKEALLHKW